MRKTLFFLLVLSSSACQQIVSPSPEEQELWKELDSVNPIGPFLVSGTWNGQPYPYAGVRVRLAENCQSMITIWVADRSSKLLGKDSFRFSAVPLKVGVYDFKYLPAKPIVDKVDCESAQHNGIFSKLFIATLPDDPKLFRDEWVADYELVREKGAIAIREIDFTQKRIKGTINATYRLNWRTKNFSEPIAPTVEFKDLTFETTYN